MSTVKLLPFDNKTELNVVLDLPQGAAVEDTHRTLQQMVEALARIPEVVAVQTYAGAASPFNFNGLVRHYDLRTAPRQGDIQVTLSPKGERRRTSHAIAPGAARAAPGRAAARRQRAQGGGAHRPARRCSPPCWPKSTARTRTPAARSPPRCARRSRACPSSSMWTTASAPGPNGVRLAIDQENLEFYQVEQADVYDAIRALHGGIQGGLFPPPAPAGRPSPSASPFRRRTTR